MPGFSLRRMAQPYLWVAPVLGLLMTGCTPPMMSPPVKAVQTNDIVALRQALDAGISPNYVEPKEFKSVPGYSLLGLSLSNGTDDITNLLIQRGADVMQAAPFAFKSMDNRDEKHALSTVKTLIEKGLDPNLPFQTEVLHGFRPLDLTKCQPKVTEYLLAKGANPNALWVSQVNVNNSLRKNSETPLAGCLHQIVNEDGYLKLFRESNNGVDFSTVIRMALSRRDRAIETALVLLRHGADPNIPVTLGDKKIPLLSKAVATGQPRVIQSMLLHGADVLAVGKPDGGTALHAAAETRDAALARDLIARAQVAARKRAASPEEAERNLHSWINQPWDKGYTPLHIAAMYGGIHILPVLIDAGADPEIQDQAGHTAQYYLDEKIAKDQQAARAAEEAWQRRQVEAREKAEQARINREGAMAILGAVAIGKATSGPNINAAQRSELVDSYVQDRVNAANGTPTDTFSQTADKVKHQMDLASMAAQRQRQLEATRAEEAGQAKAAAAKSGIAPAVGAPRSGSSILPPAAARRPAPAPPSLSPAQPPAPAQPAKPSPRAESPGPIQPGMVWQGQGTTLGLESAAGEGKKSVGGPGAGQMAKRPGGGIAHLEARWNVSQLMGEPTVNGSFSWEAEPGYSLELPSNALLWLKVQHGTTIGFIPVSPVLPASGRGFGMNVTGSPNWREAVVLEWNGSRALSYFDEQQAKRLWREGFQIVDIQLSIGPGRKSE